MRGAPPETRGPARPGRLAFAGLKPFRGEYDWSVDQADIALRNATYRRFVELGRAPAPHEVGAAVELDEQQVRGGWRRLHDAHALVLDGRGEIRMANPFSAVPTAFRVDAAGRSWYANCAWDAFGIAVVLRADARIETSCPDCGDPLALNVRHNQPDDTSLVFHVLVPATSWWQDIGFT